MNEIFSWLPEGTTHVDKIRVKTIPCFGLRAQFSPFKYVDGVLYTYRTDSDNEHGQWMKAESLYIAGKVPEVYPISSMDQSAELLRLHKLNTELLETLKRIAMSAQASVCNVEWVALHARVAIARATGEMK